ncbi:hypothetical protein LQG66_30280 [Bradyrhizobium ontarionense]|uniref:Ferric siderophore reductase C-terminal domain-containing protein n=1 Tax=Bradyrhizobium ontarionense TaxID=2898149 RepID=A0ABY3R9P1_9BRAD|nr:hypothetical protein [Bradyrhizobium sp. A19]UFZ03468.1 hypothetical protein LQG66_30280 [Bradyrhizobium sp. A19]
MPAMLELVTLARLARHPLQMMARRWYCKSLSRASRGQRRCPECAAARAA